MNTNSLTHLRRAMYAFTSSVILVLSVPAVAQTSGAVPASCTINAANSTLTCTTTVALSGVSGTFSGNVLTLNGQASGPQCNGGLTANPQQNLTPSTATAISMEACPQNTNRSTLNFRWVSPAQAANGQDPWFGTATATVPTNGSTTFSVDVCENATQTAACTRVTTAPITAAGATAPTCTAITPASQTVNVGDTASLLNANCSGATSYQWFVGSTPASGTAISGATSATYRPPTSSAGNTTYSVRAFNGAASTDNNSTATVNVQQPPPPGGCPNGEPRFTVNYSTSVQNFTYQTIVGSGVFVMRVNVAATDSSVGKLYPPTFNFTQDDTSTYSLRTIAVSQNCADFSNPSQILSSGSQTATISLVTQGDNRASNPRTAAVTPGVWYIAVRNDTCSANTNCSISGIWRNFNR